MIAIKNATLVMRDHLIPEAVLFIEDGIIAGFGEMRNTPIPEGCEIVDAEGLFVGPGLIDIHSHAGGGVRFELRLGKLFCRASEGGCKRLRPDDYVANARGYDCPVKR